MKSILRRNRNPILWLKKEKQKHMNLIECPSDIKRLAMRKTLMLLWLDPPPTIHHTSLSRTIYEWLRLFLVAGNLKQVIKEVEELNFQINRENTYVCHTAAVPSRGVHPNLLWCRPRFCRRSALRTLWAPGVSQEGRSSPRACQPCHPMMQAHRTLVDSIPENFHKEIRQLLLLFQK